MTRTDARPILLDLADELLVASTLLEILAAPEADKPVVLRLGASSVERCQELAAELVRIEMRGS